MRNGGLLAVQAVLVRAAPWLAVLTAPGLPGCVTTTVEEPAFIMGADAFYGEEGAAPPERPSWEPGPIPASADQTVAVGARFLDGTPRFGELAEVAVMVGNGGIHPVVIREVELVGQLPDPVAWLTSLPGDVRFLEGRALWYPRRSDVTLPIFARGLLFPGERLEVVRPLRVRAPRLDVVVRYQEVSMENLGAQTDAPGELDEEAPPWVGATVLLPRFRSGEKAGAASFVKFVEPRVTDLVSFRRREPGTDERLVLLIEPHLWQVESQITSLPVRWSDPSMPAALLGELGIAGGEVSRWDTRDAWIIRPPGRGTVFFHQGEEVLRLPARLPFAVFDLADARSRSGRPLLVERHGELTARSADELLDIILEARDAGSPVRIGVVDPASPHREAVLEILAGSAGPSGEVEETPVPPVPSSDSGEPGEPSPGNAPRPAPDEERLEQATPLDDASRPRAEPRP